MSEQKPDALTLLEVANKSSERLAVLHAGFMAACVYVLVIVFGTTDLDLLIGKGVQLPVVNVEVPIVGFYVLAPFILTLVHFNLLLQLQLLSRKLHAFDSAAAPEESEIGGLRDRLHIFPFTYYIAGRPGPRVQPFVALMVSITVIMLPLFTLLALQMVFLAYQEELYTWMQRIAIWMDIASVLYFWPLIINPSSSLGDYWRDLYRAHLPRKRNWIPLGLFVAGLMLFLFGTTLDIEKTEKITDKILKAWPLITGMLLISLSATGRLFLRKSKVFVRLSSIPLPPLGTGMVFFLISSWMEFFNTVNGTSIVASVILIVLFAIILFRHPEAPRGSLALLLSIFLAFPLTLAMLVDGGMLERGITTMQSSHDRTTLFCDLFLKNKRTLELREQVLLAKQPQPETLALIRSDEWKKGIRQVEPLNLQRRKLRHAALFQCIMVRADLREADLQGADLLGAELQGALLSGAQLQGAELQYAQLQGALLSGAQLQGANLPFAQLQGANLRYAQLQGAFLLNAQLQGALLSEAQLQGALLWNAQLQGALLSEAQLQGADLQYAQLQGALLSKAQLQGALLSRAQLQGADLSEAQLQGAYLRNTKIYGALFSSTETTLADARWIDFTPLPDSTYVKLLKALQTIEMYPERKDAALERLKKATKPGFPAPTFDSCLVSENTPIKCTNQLHEPEYTKRLHTYLANLACKSPDIARGIIQQITNAESYNSTSSRIGLKPILRKRLQAGNCNGLTELTDAEKRWLLDTSE